MKAIRLTDPQRELLERALDVMAGLLTSRSPPTVAEIRLYERAVSIVRERPTGQRRLRSDFMRKRRAPQAEIPLEPDLSCVKPEKQENHFVAKAPKEATP